MKPKSAVIILHIIVILLAYSAPFWLDWRLVIAGVIVYYIQIFTIGGCVLSHAQFEDKKQSFHEWYLHKIGFTVNRTILNVILRYVTPPALVGLALAFQVLLSIKVIVSP
ncbi:MAG: hypothetical protein ABI220_05080 [Candidatus Saccharimonadales bacterium]